MISEFLENINFKNLKDILLRSQIFARKKEGI